MNDSQLLERFALTDACPAGSEMPSGAWPADVAFAEVDKRITDDPGVRPATQMAPKPARSGWLVAAGTFALVLLTGVVLLALLAGDSSDPVAPTSPEPTAPTTAPPTTTPSSPAEDVQGSMPLEPGTEGLIADLEHAYNVGNPDVAARLLTPDASVSLAPWVPIPASPSSVSLTDRIATAGVFEERLEFEGCATSDGTVRCRVELTDRFADTLDLRPWEQTWMIETDGSLISALSVVGENPERAAAMDDFQAWVRDRDPEAPAIVAGPEEWLRTEVARTTLDTHIVEYGALQSGVPQPTWDLVSGFFESLNGGDIEAVESAFAPGGRYVGTDTNLESTSVGPASEAVGSAELREYWTWWHDMLQMQWSPTKCTGEASSVRCSAELEGIGVLFFPGGASQGLVDLTIGQEGITLVEDRMLLSAAGGPDLRGFWRDAWMAGNAPEIATLWPEGNGPPPGGFSLEFAQAILEYYPRYLDDIGITVPREYLDGSLLEDL